MEAWMLIPLSALGAGLLGPLAALVHRLVTRGVPPLQRGTTIARWALFAATATSALGWAALLWMAVQAGNSLASSDSPHGPSGSAVRLAVIVGLPAVLVTALAADSAVRRSPGAARALSTLSLIFILGPALVLELAFQLATRLWSMMAA
jgi:hypothetical protein